MNKICALISVPLSYLSSSSVLYIYYCASFFLYNYSRRMLASSMRLFPFSRSYYRNEACNFGVILLFLAYFVIFISDVQAFVFNIIDGAMPSALILRLASTITVLIIISQSGNGLRGGSWVDHQWNAHIREISPETFVSISSNLVKSGLYVQHDWNANQMLVRLFSFCILCYVLLPIVLLTLLYTRFRRLLLSSYISWFS